MRVWTNVCSKLKDQLPKSVYSLWIEPIRCEREDGNVLELRGSDRFFCSWVEDNYLGTIQDALQGMGFEQVQVRLTCDESVKESPVLEKSPDREGVQLQLPHMIQGKSRIKTLHPRYTFEEFVVGESNKLAQSACLAIANGDSIVGPCLYIGAETGLGKSHLTHAVAHHILSHAPSLRLHYLTAQQLSAEVFKAIKTSTVDAFKEKYHNQCDILLMEDIQSLAGKARTQEELAFALDVLIDRGKRVIFTGSIGPKDIPNLSPGIRSRLSAGLITTINPPDYKTRVRIIRHKSRKMDMQLSDSLVEFMAEHLCADIRRIESALVGVKAKASLLEMNPDLSMVKEVLGNLIDRPQSLSSEIIRDYIAGQFKVSVDEIRSKSRKKAVAFPRQISIYLSRKFTDEGLSDIGKAFNRDHSTVVHSIRVITDGMVRNASIRGQVELLSEKVKKKFQ